MNPKWVNVAIKSHFSWPNTHVRIPFEGKTIHLLPSKGNLASRVSIYNESGISFEEGGSIISRFLSGFAWSMNGGVVECFILGSNDPAKPGLLNYGTYGVSGYAQTSPDEYLYLPYSDGKEIRLALALYREAMSLNSIPFSFLSYYKVLNITFYRGGKQAEWINKNLKNISSESALKRIEELKLSEIKDIGSYMFEQGRCSVAHSFGKGKVNPDEYIHKKRLECDLPLIKELVSLFIELELGIKTTSSYLKNYKPNDLFLLKSVANNDGSVDYKHVKSAKQSVN